MALHLMRAKMQPLQVRADVMPRTDMNRKELIQDIETAFKGVLLKDGIGIYQAEALDNYANEVVIEKERDRDRTSWVRWQDIPDEIIDRYYSVLCFVDPSGMKFLLPANMRFTLKNYDITNSASLDSTIYALDRGLEGFGNDSNILSDKQKSAIAKFLKYMVLEVGEKYVDSSAASRAYEQHWSKHD